MENNNTERRDYRVRKFPKSRIATIDVFAVGLQKHHIAALVEIDVSESREKIRRRKDKGHPVSFTAWLISVIGRTVKDHEWVAAFLRGRREVIIFRDVNVSVLVEKELDGHKVPIPLLVEKANERTVESIADQLDSAKNKPLTDQDIVLQQKSARWMRLYYRLPGFIRRSFWRYLLKRPLLAFGKMGNVAFTSVGMMGNINGWFIPSSVHPVCFGVGRVKKKPVVVDDRIEIREILNLTVLMDHDVLDGALMARFISDLSANMSSGVGL